MENDNQPIITENSLSPGAQSNTDEGLKEKFSKPKIRMYGVVMFFVFFLVAIPLYILLFKPGMRSQGHSVVPSEIPTLTQAPIIINNTQDLNSAIKSLDSLSTQSANGSMYQIDTYLLEFNK